MGVRVWLRDGRVEEFGTRGDRTWTARRDDVGGTLLVAYLRGGHFEEVRRFFAPHEWARVEIDHGADLHTGGGPGPGAGPAGGP